MKRIHACILACTSAALVSCTSIRNKDLLDPIMQKREAKPAGPPRTDGYYWKETSVDGSGRKWKAIHPIVFLPGGFVKILPVIPSMYADDRGKLPDSLDTYARAKENLRKFLPTDLSSTRQYDGWGWYTADASALHIGYLSYEGIGFPFFNQSLNASTQEGRVVSESELEFEGSRYRFEPASIEVETSSLRVNHPRFRKKRFPGFFWGW